AAERVLELGAHIGDAAGNLRGELFGRVIGADMRGRGMRDIMIPEDAADALIMRFDDRHEFRAERRNLSIPVERREVALERRPQFVGPNDRRGFSHVILSWIHAATFATKSLALA